MGFEKVENAPFIYLYMYLKHKLGEPQLLVYGK